MKYPYFKLVLRTKKGEVAQTYVTRKKERISMVLSGGKKIKSTKKSVKGYVYDVSVHYKQGFWNKGIYNNLKDAKYAYSVFSSIDEMKYWR